MVAIHFYRNSSLLEAYIEWHAALLAIKKSCYPAALDKLFQALALARKYYDNNDAYIIPLKILTDITVCQLQARLFAESHGHFLMIMKLAKQQRRLLLAASLRAQIQKIIANYLLNADQYPDFNTDLTGFENKLGEIHELIALGKLYFHACKPAQQQQFTALEAKLTDYEQIKTALNATLTPPASPSSALAIRPRNSSPHSSANSFFYPPTPTPRARQPEESRCCGCSFLKINCCICLPATATSISSRLLIIKRITAGNPVISLTLKSCYSHKLAYPSGLCQSILR